mgnify:CR=1 FL=1
MRCPFCNQDNTRVVDSRPVEDTNSIRRRRLCDACGKRFTTYEKVETIPLTVIKKDQNRESYKRSKIQDGVLRACYKRPIPIERVEEMIDSIEGDIFRSEDREISSTKIGEIVMEHLKDLDAVAYVRFASVYREFKDVSTFMDELKKLIDQLGSGMELYLTGTSRCEELWPYVDEVTEMTTPYRRTPDSHFCEED